MKIKKCSMFSGSALVQHEEALGCGDPDVEMMECANSIEDGGWLRKSNCCTGKRSLEAGADRVEGYHSRCSA
jgi:hypothetical protein